MNIRLIWKVLLFVALGVAAQAHVGSPDIYLDGKAGPYQLFVTVRPPLVIPGTAELQIRSETPGVEEVRAVPLPMSGPGAQFAPIPDKLAVSPQDPQFFTGSLWMMAPGSWQIRITVNGRQGQGILAVPVPSAARATKKMQAGLGVMLSLLGLFLIAGVVAMVGASVREGKLNPAAIPTSHNKRRARIAMSIAFVIVIGLVWFGDQWWASDANSYSNRIYKPLQMKAAITNGTLLLTLTDPGWLKPRPGSFRNPLFVRKIDDLVLDHNHLMHLYAIRQPGLDVVYHLHPELVAAGSFRLNLPSMKAGSYKLYADIVHANGFPETMVTSIDIPAIQGRALSGDDAGATASPWDKTSTSALSFLLPDGYRMEWLRGPGALYARQGRLFRFRLLDPQGHAPRDMALYMGMLGHAAFVKTDGTVFAHIHPTGSVSMAAFTLAQEQTPGSASSMPEMDMTGSDMKMDMSGLPNEVGFPYGFPVPGRYRIFVQMKHGSTIETGVFDADVK